jgi:hypothetical protein
MSLSVLIGLPVALLAGTSSSWGNSEIHVSRFGDAPDLIELRFDDKSPKLRLEAANGFVMMAQSIPDCPLVHLYGVSTEASPETTYLGKITLPGTGRHILLISQTDSAKSQFKLLPFDRAAHPPGGVRFLNLTSRKIRCTLGPDSVELAPGEDKLHQKVDPARRIINHRLQSWEKKGWKTENATTLILGANNRFLFVFFQDRPESEIRSKLITDFDTERNLAPLAATPVKAEPPLPDPPAK